MAYALDAKSFTLTQMIDGTAETWLQALSIGTFHAATVTLVGSGMFLYAITYESS